MTHVRRMLREADQGFTIIEVMVAALLLVVGVTGTLAMIDTASDRTVVNQGREAGTSLARDVVEAAGNVGYDQITPGNVVTALQAQPGLASAGGSWTIERRGITYTLTATACTLDDRVDGFGTSAVKGVGGWCADSQSTGAGSSADRNPDDMRRVTVTITWNHRGKSYSVRQAGVFFNPGNAVGPRVTNMTTSPAPTALGNTNPANVTIDATADTSATRVKFWVDGVLKADVTAKTGAVWRYVWNTFGAGDATYVITAQAYDTQGRSRGAYTSTYSIDRNPATPPTNFKGGRNLRLFQANTTNSIIDLDWVASVDPDVYGYRVFRSDLTQACYVTRDTANDFTECTDVTPPTANPTTYYIVALDRDAAQNERRSGYVAYSVATDNDRPGLPGSVTATTTAEGNVKLTWTAANPGNGAKAEPVAYYRIYRDGVLYANRAGRTSGPTCPADCTWTEPVPSPGTHTWRVTAVDSKYGEGDPGPAAGIVQ